MGPNGEQYVIETLPDEAHEIRKREVEDLMGANEDLNDHLVLIYEASGGECGLKDRNRKRLYAPDLTETVRLLKPQQNKDEEPEEFQRRRRKRQVKQNVNYQKAIEIAVFVDEELYSQTKYSSSADPIDEIQNLVFAYMNSVQLLYQSALLDTKFKIIMVRLEVFKNALSDLDKKDGDIEGYLESFCKWQVKQNPEHWDKQSDHPDHWDHALMLTGVDLYDGSKKHSSVIGNLISTNKEFLSLFIFPIIIV